MIRKILKLLKYTFENGPNIGFWVGVLIILYDWCSKQSIPIRLFFIIVPLIAITTSLRRIYNEIKQQALTSAALAATEKKTNSPGVDKLTLLQNNVPSEYSLRAIYKYAQNYAERWASDGEVTGINYYLEATADVLTKRAQIFIRSSKRGEKLTTYLPSTLDGIEEFEQEQYYTQGIAPRIYSFRGWKKELTSVIETASKDLAKSDEARLQISPNVNGLYLFFYFKNGNRQWLKRQILDKTPQMRIRPKSSASNKSG